MPDFLGFLLPDMLVEIFRRIGCAGMSLLIVAGICLFSLLY